MDLEQEISPEQQLSRPIEVEEKKMGYSPHLGHEGGCYFANRLSSAAEALGKGRGAQSLQSVRQFLPFLGHQLADLESRSIEVKSFRFGDQSVQLATTPAGLAQQSDLAIKDAVTGMENEIATLPEQERSQAVQDVVKAMFPGAQINRDRATAGAMSDIRIKTGNDRTQSVKRGLVTAAMGTATLLENAMINSIIGSLNLVEEVTAAPGFAPTPVRWFSSDHLKHHLENTKAHSLEEVMKSSVQAELLLRECLVHQKGRAQPEINPARSRFMSDLVASWREQERELKGLADERDQAIKAAAHNDQERVRREQNEKIRERKEELLTDLGLETEADRAFGNKVIRKMEKEPLTAKVLEDSILGQPLLERLRDDFVVSAMKEGPTPGDAKVKRDGKY